jgi:hypothetical protein
MHTGRTCGFVVSNGENWPTCFPSYDFKGWDHLAQIFSLIVTYL